MFIEIAIGTGVAIVVMVAIAQLVAVIGNQRVHSDQQRLATREAANALERVLAASWSDLDPEAPPEVKISASAEERLDDPRLSVVITESQEDLLVKRIEVRVDWVNRAGQRTEPLRLVAWRHGERSPDADVPPEEASNGEGATD